MAVRTLNYIRAAMAKALGPGRFIVAGVLLVWLICRITPTQWMLVRDGLDTRFVLLATFLTASALAINFIRWKWLLKNAGVSVGLMAAIQLGCIGYASGFFAIGSLGGDVLKATLLVKRFQCRTADVFVATAMDRLIGLYSLGILTSVSFLSMRYLGAAEVHSRLTLFGRVACAAVVVGGLGLYACEIRTRRRRAQPILRTMPNQALDVRSQGLSSNRGHSGYALALILSLLSQSMVILSVFSIAKAVHNTETIPSILEHFILVPFALLAAAAPISPGGIGVFEATLDWMYSVITSTSPRTSGALVGLAFNLLKLAFAAVTLVAFCSSGSSTKSVTSTQR